MIPKTSFFLPFFTFITKKNYKDLGKRIRGICYAYRSTKGKFTMKVKKTPKNSPHDIKNHENDSSLQKPLSEELGRKNSPHDIKNAEKLLHFQKGPK